MKRYICFVATFLLVCTIGLNAETNEVKQKNVEKVEPNTWKAVFPSALIKKPFMIDSMNPVYGAKTEKEASEEEKVDQSKLQSVLLNNDIVAIYGKPNAYTMGLLGQYPLEEIEPIVNEFAKMYDDANEERGIIPALYMIYGTCWPEGEIGILPKSITEKYIEFAAKKGWFVYLDHQIGKYTVEEAMSKLLPFLKYPNVHLALDPEWNTTKPMKEIGSVTGQEINTAQKMMNDYIIENNIPGNRMLVIHQFNCNMIRNRKSVRSDFERVQLIHCSDGFGSPRLKKDSYAYNALATNMPLKSFKLFLKPTVDGAGYDQPLMKPEEVLKLNPRPCFIMYQ